MKRHLAHVGLGAQAVRIPTLVPPVTADNVTQGFTKIRTNDTIQDEVDRKVDRLHEVHDGLDGPIVVGVEHAGDVKDDLRGCHQDEEHYHDHDERRGQGHIGVLRGGGVEVELLPVLVGLVDLATDADVESHQ